MHVVFLYNYNCHGSFRLKTETSKLKPNQPLIYGFSFSTPKSNISTKKANHTALIIISASTTRWGYGSELANKLSLSAEASQLT